MASSQLSIYNKALRWLEERPITTAEAAAALTSGSREPVRLLNAEWTDAVQFCLYQGFWKFSLRTVMANPDVAQAPTFGRKYSYSKPSDWVRTYQFSPDDRFLLLDRDYIDENNAWFTDLPFFYVRYVSNDVNRGLDMSLWTPGFVEYLSAYLASLCAPRIMQDDKKVSAVEMKVKKKKSEALATDAMDAPPGKIPPGSWVQSRTPRGSVYSLSGGWDEY